LANNIISTFAEYNLSELLTNTYRFLIQLKCQLKSNYIFSLLRPIYEFLYSINCLITIYGGSGFSGAKNDVVSWQSAQAAVTPTNK